MDGRNTRLGRRRIADERWRHGRANFRSGGASTLSRPRRRGARRTPAELEVHYRHVPALEENFAVAAVFRGIKSSTQEIVRRLDESQEKRRTTQPAAKSAGCIFKNPNGCPAGKLVDELGLKGWQVGDARVSEVHGNFIVNEGAATAHEVLELIGQIQATVRRERGIELETEVQIVGEEA